MKKITIRGSVQGVSYRYSAKRAAKELNIKGTVKNMEDGSVEIYACGEEQNLKAFIEKCKKGSGWSTVEDLIVEELEDREFENFSITH